MSELIKVGITHGDVNGVGYEILFKTFSDIRLLELFNPIIYGSSKSASYHRKVLNNNTVNFNIINSVEESREGKINLLNCVKDETRIDIGKPSAEAGESSYIALECAVKDLQEKKIDVLVTLPINKDSIQSEQFNFPGHTEYLEERFAAEGEKALMIMATQNMRVALVTTHIPLKDVSASLSKELIAEKIRTLNNTLKRDFSIDAPRIAVLGLNPHAGENGMLGNEENEIIAPVIREAQEEWILCAGPYPPDGFFGSGRFKEFDAILAMYHDQGLIPFKTMAMDMGVNYTAGLPIVRTSPDHGTAYDIAGKNEASDESFRQAIYMAIDIYRNRHNYDEARKNPLKKLFYDRGRDDEKLDLMKEE
ncbi:MAG TPA: 4-hydroxythreonine-4-phosphate dehydrogenase PdxA [Fermentimonas caenicola]|jgi:4-hydroxythreonine-4-phosphate dehydrogenase|uniref:4-hydroxythreonine-4-phosphate dehydrogenase PdxA n=1 Tax=Lascolabacillus sp. TaxID=1924068 RepID=UPI000A42483F|nr:4-hydroxythreonine-4-phosphate dehydrogenase PdxA [Lascolabacillus sp.]MBP6174705.1 4-hydroxythreonine-4-phosphate dehydrogenase PdxA [Fermentimonas sp.]MDI9625048.1 4-hydroxythreonine-4-phosphate dehydrogenase PdxA [Bacteroidota bacterium]HHU41405.1 4-hydroxythreonine-4-phosphate dehydrogenase PdxA [Fermentimonas caenicola]MBP6195893.1 4-hydroxythreonine-4-phosphate dehydrogenase PdxA [Fermentimonas sp.]MBP7103835.1 4-hydroxythreonine-4-phosphate dehydrogenase PdxA [Fermentimonas sp.]